MQILNIGPLELIVALLIMFLLLGPKEMILTAQRIGRWIRNFVRSPMWREILGYSQEIRELPQKLMDDTGLKEALDDVKQTTQQTANELNSTVREAVQDARVPEAENLKIETGSGVLPGAKTARPEPVKAATSTVPAKIEETQTIAPPGMVAEEPAVAGEPAGAEDKAIVSAGVADSAAEAELPAAIVAAAPMVESRAPKVLPADILEAAAAASSAAEAAAAASAAAEAVAAAIAAAEAAAQEPPKPRRSRARKVDVAAGAAQVEPEIGAAGTEGIAAQEPPKPRRARARKAVETAPAAADSETVVAETSGEPEPEVVSPAALANQRAVEALADQVKALSGGADGAAVAVEAPVVPEVPGTDLQEPPKPRRTRARKVVEAAVVGLAPDAAAVQVEPETAAADAEITAAPEPKPEAVSAAALANRSAVEALAAQVRALSGDAGASEAGNGTEPALEQKKTRRSRARKVAAEELPAAEEHVEGQ